MVECDSEQAIAAVYDPADGQDVLRVTRRTQGHYIADPQVCAVVTRFEQDAADRQVKHRAMSGDRVGRYRGRRGKGCATVPSSFHALHVVTQIDSEPSDCA